MEGKPLNCKNRKKTVYSRCPDCSEGEGSVMMSPRDHKEVESDWGCAKGHDRTREDVLQVGVTVS